MKTGLSSWNNDIRDKLAELNVNLRVLVWGPGETNRVIWLDKRKEVIDALVKNPKGKDEVLTSEELFKKNAPLIETGYAELAHAATADIIIALIMASPSKQGGVYRELEIIASHRELRNKVWIFLPENKSYLKRFQAGMLQVYKEHQKITLPWQMLRTCERLRDICISKVNEERNQRMFDKMIAHEHTSGK